MAATASTAATQLSRRHLKPWMVTAGGAPLGLLGGSRDEHHGPGMHGVLSGEGERRRTSYSIGKQANGTSTPQGG